MLGTSDYLILVDVLATEKVPREHVAWELVDLHRSKGACCETATKAAQQGRRLSPSGAAAMHGMCVDDRLTFKLRMPHVLLHAHMLPRSAAEHSIASGWGLWLTRLVARGQETARVLVSAVGGARACVHALL